MDTHGQSAPDTIAPRDELIAIYLRKRDVPCPKCGYNRRDGTTAACPECDEHIVLNHEGSTEHRRYTTITKYIAILIIVFESMELIRLVVGAYNLTHMYISRGSISPPRFFVLGVVTLVVTFSVTIAMIILAIRRLRACNRGEPYAVRLYLAPLAITIGVFFVYRFINFFVWVLFL